MLVGLELTNSKTDIANKLAKIPSIILSEQLFEKPLKTALDKYIQLGGSDQVSKGSLLVEELLK